jgi:hypothetical protein
MAHELYKDRWEEAPTDSLRLADEFRIYLGQAALTEFLHRQIADASWEPSELHRTLMGLPWSDILTTNYDTLLERASHKHRAVRDDNDLSQVRGPRVIKLHGSIDANTHLILSEDDFRTYPLKHAAFVNTARQIFLENELCLVGFSGDDPNFLQWSGWVRDHLGERARRIYLVGSLNLSSAKRKLLESRGISPIDFFPLMNNVPTNELDKKCCELFLSYLLGKRPERAIDWQPCDNNAYPTPDDPIAARNDLESPHSAVPILRNLEGLWRLDRTNCPRWLVLPKTTREKIKYGTQRAPWGYLRALKFIDAEFRAEFIALVLWRKMVSLEKIDSEIEAEANLAIETNQFSEIATRIFIISRLMVEARHRRDQLTFDRMSNLLEKSVNTNSDAHAELIAQKLMWARDGLDYVTLEKNAKDLRGPSPVWALLQASFQFECGNTDAARALTTKIRDDMADRARRDRQSASAASRFAWATVLSRAEKLSERWTPQQKDREEDLANGYDADEEVDSLSLQIRANRLRRNEEPDGFQPRFGAGRYKDHSRTIKFGGSVVGEEAETVFRLAESAYLPLRILNVDIFGTSACYALDAEPLYTLEWYLRLVRSISSYSSPFVDRHFDRISIAKMEDAIASELLERVFSAAKFWQTKINPTNPFSTSTAVERLRALIEILSRLVVRADSERALRAFRFACNLFVTPRFVHHWLYESIGGLLEWSLTALPKDARGGLAIDCIEFPLPIDVPDVPFTWPDPTSILFANRIDPNRPAGDGRWRAAVAALLVSARSIGKARSIAINRLAYLHTHDSLDSEETSSFATALWSARDTQLGDLPADVDLFPHVIAFLPAPNGVNPLGVIESYLFDAAFDPPTVDNRLNSIVGAARGGHPIPKILPGRDQAARLLDEMASLMPPESQSDPIGADIASTRVQLIGEVIGRSILPQLLPDDLDIVRHTFLSGFAQLGRGGGALSGWHELARLLPFQLSKTTNDLRRAISRGDIFETSAAAYSVGTWAGEPKDRGYPPIPDSLKDSLLASLEGRSHQSLQPRLWAVRQLFKFGELCDQRIDVLTCSIRDLSIDLSYNEMPREGSAAVGITAARAEFVRLVRNFSDAGQPFPAEANWVLTAETDPLPEVRFATDYMK